LQDSGGSVTRRQLEFWSTTQQLAFDLHVVHAEPRMSPPVFADLFAGIGGTRLAFERAGARCVWSCEVDRFCRLTYEANFGHPPDAGDIREVDAAAVPDHDILVAGFPCQPFSIAGVSKLGSLGRPHGFVDRTRGTLFFEICRILEAKRPRALFLENVRHLVRHDGGRTFRIILETLSGLGYRVDYRVIDAARLVPQHRERVYIVGFREPVWFAWPEVPDRRPRLGEILEPVVDTKYTLSRRVWRTLRRHREKHRRRGNGFGYGLADPDGVARTLSARYYKDGAEILIAQGRGRPPRRLTPRECARLMGFPDSFVIPVSDTQAYRQFGNSVVVPLVEVLAGAVLEALGYRQGACVRGAC
jgi:DNA (cytosine-5)-methyltransferase 1